MRKTISVSDVKDYCNNLMKVRNDNIPEFSPEFKMGVAYVLDYVLNQTGNYKGYNYYDDYDPENWSEVKEWNRKYH
jgi:hypothetical protein